MGCGLLRGFGGGSDANTSRAVGERDNLLVDADLFDLFQPLFVEGKDGIADELLLFQFVDYIAIIAGWKVSLLGDLRGDGFHFPLDLYEGLMRHGGELGGRNVDAVAFELE